MYRYVGVHWLCKMLVSLSLISAAPAGGHTAAFVGAQTQRSSQWVQAGVASVSAVSRPFLYVEWRWEGRNHLMVLPWSFGERATGRLQHRGGFWRAGVGGMWTPWLRIRSAQRCSGLELFRGAHGTARVSGRLLAG